MPGYQKISMIIMLAVTALTVIFAAIYILMKSKICVILFWIGFSIVFLILITLFISDSTKKNLRRMLDNYYSVYSYKRMKMLKNILQKYGLDAKDMSTIDLLIKEAKKAQKENNPFISLSKSTRALGAGVISIIVYVAKEIADSCSTEKLVYMALVVIIIIICLISMFFSLAPIFKDLIYRDDKIYNDLIYDLRQQKIFSN